MERCDYRLHDFTRMAWASEEARGTWAPRFTLIRKALSEVEKLSVARGIRPCALFALAPDELVREANRWADRGLLLLPMEKMDTPDRRQTARGASVSDFTYTCVLGKYVDAMIFRKLWSARDTDKIGRLLGYPRCCRDFFIETREKQGHIDFIWRMAEASSPSPGERAIDLSVPVYTNVLWRWMDIVSVPYMPCSFYCEPTIAFVKKFFELGRASGFTDEYGWLEEVLSWPVDWSALHGIAEIRTPVLKVIATTDATPVKYTVRIRPDQ